MGQMQPLGRELFAYGREKAGEDVMGPIVGSIPGLSPAAHHAAEHAHQPAAALAGAAVAGLGDRRLGAGHRELFAYGREKAGEDVMGPIVGSIPGLSQFV
jgi:hypothetical protein